MVANGLVELVELVVEPVAYFRIEIAAQLVFELVVALALAGRALVHLLAELGRLGL